MKNLRFLTIAFVLASLSLLSSCKKEGCTDTDGINYSADAKKDDGSCKYEGTVQFWYDQATAESLVASGSTSLTYYIDGSIVGSSAANIYYTSAPSCTQSSVVRQTKELGNGKSKTSTYSVKDDIGDEIWTGTVTFDGTKSCTSYQLTW
jgi:hypothetical protein